LQYFCIFALINKKMPMKKLLMVCVTGLSMVTISWSQPPALVIQGEKGKFYLQHTVDVKQNWYSVGRLYNISPKEIAPFNGLTMNKPLSIGQQLKIPLTAVNFSQKGTKAADEALVPLYHIIQEKEWMYHISVVYNKVPIESLEKWNHINRDQAKAGMQLVVGYLKVKTAQSALAAANTDRSLAQVQAPAAIKKEETKSLSTVTSDPPSKDPKGVEPLPRNQTPVSGPEARPADKTTAAAPSITGPVKPADKTTVAAPSITGPVNYYAANHTGGYFSTDFTGNNKTASGQAGIFKSTSGWQDGKYYALMNNVPVGTIVKVASTSSNKAIFAKVLGQLPDMKESAGLTIRISNAAASELAAGDGKFAVEVKY
jgi:LysM repeat protein